MTRHSDRYRSRASARSHARSGDPAADRERRRDRSRRHWYGYAPEIADWYYRRPRRRILGVCAWIADYLRIDAWVVRLCAILGLIFMGSFVFPAYLIAGLVLHVQRRRRQDELAALAELEMGLDPEFGPIPAPGATLNETGAKMRRLEEKLRRMEAHVTSGHFELQRAFRQLDQ